MTSYARERAKEHIADLADRGNDLVTFRRESTEVLSRAVAYHWTPC